MTIQDSTKAYALTRNPLLQSRIMYCIWRHALFAWNQDADDKQARMDAAKLIQADPVKLQVVTMLILTAPGIIATLDPANSGEEATDEVLLGQAEQFLTFWAETILSVA